MVHLLFPMLLVTELRQLTEQLNRLLRIALIWLK